MYDTIKAIGIGSVYTNKYNNLIHITITLNPFTENNGLDKISSELDRLRELKSESHGYMNPANPG